MEEHPCGFYFEINRCYIFDQGDSVYPIEVTQKMLECFDGAYMLQKRQPAKAWLSRIADIGEELWVYSKNRELLFEEDDKQYLFDNLNEIKYRINDMLKELDSCVNEDVLSAVKELCSDVYRGDSFDDEKYNKLISYVQAAST